MCGNRVRNGSDRKPETGETRSPKLALLKIPIGAALHVFNAFFQIKVFSWFYYVLLCNL